SASASPGGKYLIYYKDKNWWTYEIKSGNHTNITENIDAKWFDENNVSGSAFKRPFGSGNWIKDDKFVHVYDQFDVYRVTPDGKKFEKLTDGAADKIRFRIQRIDFEEPYLEENEPLYFSAYGEFTKDSGYYVMEKGKKPVKLIYESFGVGRIIKPEDADVFFYTKQREDDSPDYFMVDKSFGNEKQVTITNPQQDDYYWGSSELITYTNTRGEELQGKLLYPANYEAGKKYPMIVYIYELRSQSLHNYTLPTKTSAYSQRRFSADGFFVYEPDITYRLNDPGVSAVECLVPAVKKVVDMGLVNPDQVGLTGHSWGAYQTCFVVTQTDIFNAAVAGAPLINMISMSHSIYWNSGSTDLQIFETSQGRLEEPFWYMQKKYEDNSPLYHARNITTPLMIAFGTNDGAVDFNQGVEMYTAMQRLQKPFVMLVYDGENHGLRKKENQIDYATRMHDWMKHYLLGIEPAEWITEGVSILDKPVPKKNDGR
ncbi:alpha/beta hydrolase family protein, partial [candidate division KSB1 bacterium]